jgi:carboxymethylenebutenolidase
MKTYVARPAGAGPFPGILVFQEAFGVNHHIRGVCDRFASIGYLAAAPDLFHRFAPDVEIPYDDMEGAMAHVRRLTIDGLEEDIRAADALLRREAACSGRIVSVGFCMGGFVSFLANSILPLPAAVSFYGGRIASVLDRAPRQSGKLLLIWGGQDQHIGPDKRAAARDALEAARKPYVETLFSYAGHGFFCDERASYNADAAREAWALTTAFLQS